MNINLNFFVCILCLALSIVSFGQNQEIDKIKAVKLTAAVGEQYFKKLSLEAFTVDKNNILRPAKGYKIVFFSTEKKIAILPKTMKLVSPKPSAPGFDTSKVPGGTMFCMCDEAVDNCNINTLIWNNTLIFKCEGRCGCGSFIIYDTSDPVLGYETGGSGWYNF